MSESCQSEEIHFARPLPDPLPRLRPESPPVAQNIVREVVQALPAAGTGPGPAGASCVIENFPVCAPTDLFPETWPTHPSNSTGSPNTVTTANTTVTNADFRASLKSQIPDPKEEQQQAQLCSSNNVGGGLHVNVNVKESRLSRKMSLNVRRLSRVIPKCVQRHSFVDQAIETLYQSYCQQQKTIDLRCFFWAGLGFAWAAAIRLSLTSISSSTDVTPLPSHSVTALFILVVLLGIVQLALLIIAHRSRSNSNVAVVVGNPTATAPQDNCCHSAAKWPLLAPWIAWICLQVSMISYCVVMHFSGDGLAWLLLITYLTYVTLPLRVRTCSAMGIFSTVTYILLEHYFTPESSNNSFHIALIHALALTTGNVLGFLAFVLADGRQRRAFLNTRQSIEMQLVIEEQSKEQERLLLSVLPKHVATQMRQDLDLAGDGQFKKIYMSRHENVSILYADIVGFTAISSTCPASQLVHILNELFARFDHLAQAYHQLRIKILGDCYYCISGAPEERPDHAILCVHMGLAMVDAISSVKQSTLSPVDMRVGIHTGAVLAGVLGQRQWQFDVYSQDVELANKMESSGLPGKVHVSSHTLKFLQDQFEVEPGYGEKREEALRLAGLKTYFIVRALKPMPPPEYSGSRPTASGATVPTSGVQAICSTTVTLQGVSTTCVMENSCPTALTKSEKGDSQLEKHRLLLQQLTGRDGLLRQKTYRSTLKFINPNQESQFLSYKDKFAAWASIGCPLTFLMLAFSQWLLWDRSILFCGITAAGALLITCITLLCIAEAYEWGSQCWKCWYKHVNHFLWLKALLIITAIFILQLETNTFEPLGNDLLAYQPVNKLWQSVMIWTSFANAPNLTLPLKFSLIFFIALASFTRDMLLTPMFDDLVCVGTVSLTLIGGVLVFSLLARHMESMSRVLFLWQSEVAEQRERAADMKRRNQALVYNILPAHVASYFLNAQRQLDHQELYSQSYSSVGVLFASMPNFSEFYSEESVNNQGLECLRFLNEVISDYDALLDKPQFAEITKIKTIGSTYMAASGLNPAFSQSKVDDDITTRWRHLALLVEFALEMQQTLNMINEQSFNHFVLRMGINHGPITGGVIGAALPHYDIWGNSVNVASRMESTGKAGCIQVTEETCKILQNFGYVFEERGLVLIKGKGQLVTYYLVGKQSPSSPLTGTG